MKFNSGWFNHKTEETTFPEVEVRLTRVLGRGELSPIARQRIWRKMQARAAAAVPPTRAFLKQRLLYPVFLIVLVLSFVGSYGGVVLVSGASLPGELWYPLERRLETVWLSFTPTVQRPEVKLILLERRIYEVKALLEAHKPVPSEAFQEVELLFLSLDEADAATLLPYITEYRDTLYVLDRRYPGLVGLSQALTTANTVVLTWGGTPVEGLPANPGNGIILAE